LSIKESIEELYQKILLRTADKEGLNYYSYLFKSGKLTLDDIKNELDNSDEKKYLNSRSSLLNLLPKKSRCVEIGIWKGEFSKKILEIVDPIEFHLIDPWKLYDDPVHQNSLYGKNIDQNTLDLIFQSTHKLFLNYDNIFIHRDFSKNALKKFNDDYFDWIYIDGDHAYSSILNDLELSYQKIKKDGIICGDDYVSGNWWKDDVIRAVDDFSRDYNCTLQVINTQFLLKPVK
jgi:hypothetical protein